MTLLITVWADGQFGDQPVAGARVTVRKPKIAVPGERITLVDADGSFVLEGLVGDHCLLLYGIPYGWRLQRITHQGRDMTGVPLMFEFGQEVGPVIFWVEAGPQSGDANSSCAR